MKSLAITANRVYGLDILRAFAILFVIYSHSFFLIVDHVNERAYNIFSLDGVTLFFVLSGFLIGGILLKSITAKRFILSDLIQFWIRRWFRTLPNYFFMLVLLIMLSVYFDRQLPGNLFSYFLFIQNFSSPHPAFFPEAWSLSVEEWFYLTVPFGFFISILIIGSHRRRLILSWIIGIILLVTFLRVYRAIHFEFTDFETWDNFQRKLVITRLDSIMFGFLGAWLRFYYNGMWIRWKKLLLLVGLIMLFYPMIQEALFGSNMFYTNYLSLSITSVGTLFLLPGLSELKNGKGVIYRFLTFVSVVSYSMYLVNFSLVQLTIIPSLTQTIVWFTTNQLTISMIRYVLYWVLTFALSYIMYRFYEAPMMNLRERIRIWRSQADNILI